MLPPDCSADLPSRSQQNQHGEMVQWKYGTETKFKVNKIWIIIN